jgi:hypothetical protein
MYEVGRSAAGPLNDLRVTADVEAVEAPSPQPVVEAAPEVLSGNRQRPKLGASHTLRRSPCERLLTIAPNCSASAQSCPARADGVRPGVGRYEHASM